MTAVWMRVRWELRSTLRAALLMALVVGLAGGAILAVAAGARRTATAYSRFLDSTKSADVVVAAGGGFYPGYKDVDLAKVAALPEVAASRSFLVFTYLEARTDDGRTLPFGDVGGIAGPDPGEERQINVPRVVSGRLPDPTRVNEIAIGQAFAEHEHLGVSRTLDLTLINKQFRPGARVRVVITGVVAEPGTLTIAPYFWQIFYTSAFYRAYQADHGIAPALMVRLKGGEKQIPQFHNAVDRLAGGPGPLIPAPGRDQQPVIDRVTGLTGTVLSVFAGLAGLTGLLVLAQTLARQLFLRATENPTLRSLGMTRRQLFASAIGRVVLVAVVAAAIAVVTAILLSPLFPIGIARQAEPHRGMVVDRTVVGLGAMLLAAAVVLVSVVPAWLVARVKGGIQGTAELAASGRPSFLVRFIGGTGLPPSAAAGVRMAVEPGKGRTTVPVRSALAAVTLAIAAIAANSAFGASYAHWHDSPRLYGWNWDAMVGGAYGNPDVTTAQMLQLLEGDRSISGISKGTLLLSIRVGTPGHALVPANVLGVNPVRGRVLPTILQGRWPTSSDEVALGTETLKRLGARVGEVVDLRTSDASARLRVVGRAVFPELASGGSPGLGIGVGLTYPGAANLIPSAPENTFLITFARGVDSTAAVRRLNHTQPIDGTVAGPSDGTTIKTYRAVDRVPPALGALLGVLAVATLGHMLVTSIRRRRHDLAILKTLGFLRSDVRTAVAWQATTFTVLASALGIPLGIAIGRWVWIFFADRLGIPAVSVLPGLVVAALAPAAIVIANLVAAVPARVAARTRPALVLRSE